jgi:hypothetical protein
VTVGLGSVGWVPVDVGSFSVLALRSPGVTGLVIGLLVGVSSGPWRLTFAFLNIPGFFVAVNNWGGSSRVVWGSGLFGRCFNGWGHPVGEQGS